MVPTRVQFELTYRCNIHCVHCYTDPFNRPEHLRRELGFEEIVRILDELKEAGALWMTLTGGEAFVHPRFRDIYLAAGKRGFVLSLYTNATTVTESLADFLAQNPPFTIDISCHGATPETFDRITQVKGSFDRFRFGVEHLLARGLPLTFKTKAMTENRGELSKIRELVESWGQEFHLYTTIHPRLNGDLSSTTHRLSPEEILDLEQKVPGTFLQNNERVCNPPYAVDTPAEEPASSKKVPGTFWPGELLAVPPDDRLFRCGCGTNSCTISPYGMLRPCTLTTWPEFDLKTVSFKEAFAKMSETIRGARYQGDSPCRSCQVYRFCHKNPSTARVEAGAMESPVPHYCDLAFGRAARLENGL